MAYPVTCAVCGQHFLYDAFHAIISYTCGHVEHEHCYFIHHLQNKMLDMRTTLEYTTHSIGSSHRVQKYTFHLKTRVI
jgi:hypothetical protein